MKLEFLPRIQRTFWLLPRRTLVLMNWMVLVIWVEWMGWAIWKPRSLRRLPFLIQKRRGRQLAEGRRVTKEVQGFRNVGVI